MQRTKKWFRDLFRRRVFITLLILLQLILIAYLIVSGSKRVLGINIFLNIISIVVALHIIAKKDKGAYKLTWIFIILVFPLFGGLFYLLFKLQSSTRAFSRKLKIIERRSKKLFLLSGDCYQDSSFKNKKYISEINYLQKFANFPVYKHTEATFLKTGESAYYALLDELKKAKKYIFLEYFIISEGLMWDSILEILKQKVKRGVEVRLIYDDVGCFLKLPNNYDKTLRKYGIKCHIFNKFRPFLTTVQNNRDHRKIAIIDGKVAFTGGFNLADEYINAYQRFGHWKDAGIMVKGEAAWSFTLMFLQIWSICNNATEDYTKYYPWKVEKCDVISDGYVQPYADSPMDKENIGEHVYLHIINNAKKYLYINTPYLIIDDSMTSALMLAAKSGVDVRIVVPHKADKKTIHFTTRSYYRDLIASGVKIYEYSAGFIHSKTFVSDDVVATVGTTNLDFRSLYLNFECGTCLYDASCIKNMKKDFEDNLKMCEQITLEDCSDNIVIKLLQDICRLFAPLM